LKYSTVLLITSLLLASGSARAQQRERVVVQGAEVTIGGDAETVTIAIDGRVVKSFKQRHDPINGTTAAFEAYEGTYLVWRAWISQGACAGGDIFVFRFPRDRKTVEASTPINDCFGEWPDVSFKYAAPKGELVIDVSGFVLRPERSLTRWSKPTGRNK
jgi:hypothetical protein